MDEERIVISTGLLRHQSPIRLRLKLVLYSETLSSNVKKNGREPDQTATPHISLRLI